jgi:hypothetical protein
MDIYETKTNLHRTYSNSVGQILFFQEKTRYICFFYVFFLYKKFLNINQKTYELI